MTFEVPGWHPQEAVVARFEDLAAGGEMTQAKFNAMFSEMQGIANKYGFDLRQWGTSASFARYYRSILSHRE